MHLTDMLNKIISLDGSDLYLTVGAEPKVRVAGDFITIDDTRLSKKDLTNFTKTILSEEQWTEFMHTHEFNVAYSFNHQARFRINFFVQRDSIAIVIRCLKYQIPETNELGLPEQLKKIIMLKRGLVLFVGAAGAGKSTSLASLIKYRSLQKTGHIITIENPIEYLHQHAKSLINQREVGMDSTSYEAALINALKQAPDVILIGEICERSTMQYALNFSETGHLCLSTLHANNSNQALDRIITFFPKEMHRQIRLNLALNLRAIISQRLIPAIEGGYVAAFEILIGTALIQELIVKEKTIDLKTIMERSTQHGMQTFDDSLLELYKTGKISEQDALAHSDSENNLRLIIALNKGTVKDSCLNMELMDERNGAFDDLRFQSGGNINKLDENG